jgi:hypothetical protein
MPVVLRVGGFAFRIIPGDHDPPHVHVRYSGRACKVFLESLAVTHSSMNAKEEAATIRLVDANHPALYAAWLEFRQGKAQ